MSDSSGHLWKYCIKYYILYLMFNRLIIKDSNVWCISISFTIYFLFVHWLVNYMNTKVTASKIFSVLRLPFIRDTFKKIFHTTIPFLQNCVAKVFRQAYNLYVYFSYFKDIFYIILLLVMNANLWCIVHVS